MRYKLYIFGINNKLKQYAVYDSFRNTGTPCFTSLVDILRYIKNYEKFYDEVTICDIVNKSEDKLYNIITVFYCKEYTTIEEIYDDHVEELL